MRVTQQQTQFQARAYALVVLMLTGVERSKNGKRTQRNEREEREGESDETRE